MLLTPFSFIFYSIFISPVDHIVIIQFRPIRIPLL